jgi:hypothetical protein
MGTGECCAVDFAAELVRKGEEWEDAGGGFDRVVRVGILYEKGGSRHGLVIKGRGCPCYMKGISASE